MTDTNRPDEQEIAEAVDILAVVAEQHGHLMADGGHKAELALAVLANVRLVAVKPGDMSPDALMAELRQLRKERLGAFTIIEGDYRVTMMVLKVETESDWQQTSVAESDAERGG